MFLLVEITAIAPPAQVRYTYVRTAMMARSMFEQRRGYIVQQPALFEQALDADRTPAGRARASTRLSCFS